MKKSRLFLLSVFSGALLACGWPAIGGFEPFLFIGLVPLLFVEEVVYSKKMNGFYGYAFVAFSTFNILTTWWIFCVTEGIATKLLVVSAAVLVNSTMMALVWYLFHFTRKRIGTKEGLISLPVYWLAFEYLHHHWELSWPWMTLGNGFAEKASWIQWYEYTGVLGGTLWVLLVNIVIFTTLKNAIFEGTPLKRNLRGISAGSLLLLLPITYSEIRYAYYLEKGRPVNVAVVQPNMDPYNEKYALSYQEQLAVLGGLAASKCDLSTDYIVAPETALTEDLLENNPENSYSVNFIKKFLENYPGADFVSGASSYKIFLHGEQLPAAARPFSGEKKWYEAYNTALQIKKSGDIQIYHKSKLVQGVEKMPFAWLLKPLEKLALDMGGTTGSLGSQKESSVFDKPEKLLKIAPVICYESIYGEYVASYINKGAQLIFIMTNDGWWDDTPGYKQHIAYARLRAIETRRSIARAANTGISCFINQRGDILQQSAWWKATALKGTLLANDTMTFYARAGDYLGRIAAFLSIALLAYSLVRPVYETLKKEQA